MGQRSGDRWALPFCRPCHETVEAIGSKNESAWFRERGMDGLRLATEIWEAWSREETLRAMQLALFRHRIECEPNDRETDDGGGLPAAHPATD